MPPRLRRLVRRRSELPRRRHTCAGREGLRGDGEGVGGGGGEGGRVRGRVGEEAGCVAGVEGEELVRKEYVCGEWGGGGALGALTPKLGAHPFYE